MDQKIRRGIDLENRFGSNSVTKRFTNAFDWWKGGKLNKNSLFFITAVFIINLLVIFPIFGRDLSASYSSSFLLIFADIAGKFGISDTIFFSILTIVSLSFAPISYYLFVRRMAQRHELTAFLATLIFVIPNPVFPDGLPLAKALLNGDGSHAFVFSFVPLLLLYIQAFLANGIPAWGIMSSIGISVIAIISPFAMFNLLIISLILTISEGFLGNFRIKLVRFIFMLSISLGLSVFWYYPNVLTQATLLSHVSLAIDKILSILPLLVPVIPLFGVLSFLLFDKREKLKGLFVACSLFFIYFFLSSASRNLNISGIFTADRYLIESSFAQAFLFSISTILLVEFLVRKYILNKEKEMNKLIALFAGSFFFTFLVLLSFSYTVSFHSYLRTNTILNTYNFGIGSIKRSFGFNDFFSVIALLISLATLGFLVFILRKFPLSSNISAIIKEEKK